jgi:hypothetical protein
MWIAYVRGSDSGVAWVEICGTPDLDVEDIKLLKKNGQLDPAVAPALEGGQRPHDFAFSNEDTGPCFDGDGVEPLQDLRLKYFTCTVAENGMAQVIWANAGAGECTNDPVQDHDTCPVGIQGERSNPTAAGVPVILQDVMDVEVNNVKAIP